MHSEQLLSFHVYRVGGFLGNDKIVKAQDKVTAAYYLKGSRGVAQWEFALYAKSLDGPLIFRVSSGYTGPPIIDDIPSGLMVINIASERCSTRLERRRGTPDGTLWFRGPDDRDYYWKSRMHFWRNEMRCLDTEGELVATYRATTMAISKDGELRIYPSCNTDTELLACNLTYTGYDCKMECFIKENMAYDIHEALSNGSVATSIRVGIWVDHLTLESNTSHTGARNQMLQAETLRWTRIRGKTEESV